MSEESTAPVTLEALTEEFQAYLTKEGLPQLSADELLHHDLTDAQRRYVSDFYNRWNAVEDRKDGWIVRYKEGSGAVSATGFIGPYDTREEAERQTARMIDRYPYWEPTGDPEQLREDQ